MSSAPALNPYSRAQQSDEFRELRRSFRRFVFPVSAFFLTWYFAYVIAAAFFPSFMATKIIGNINVGLVMGLLQFVTTFAITIGYVRWANRTFDPQVASVRAAFERQHIDLTGRTVQLPKDAAGLDATQETSQE